MLYHYRNEDGFVDREAIDINDTPCIDSKVVIDDYYDNEINMWCYRVVSGKVIERPEQKYKYCLDINNQIIAPRGMSRWDTTMADDEIWLDAPIAQKFSGDGTILFKVDKGIVKSI